MTVKKITANLKADTPSTLSAFYQSLFELDVAMDMGWIMTLTSGTQAPVQVSIASDGGTGTDVPDLSIEVDDVDAVYSRAERLGAPITYPLTDEPWGVRRFFVKDPSGRVLNVLQHL